MARQPLIPSIHTEMKEHTSEEMNTSWQLHHMLLLVARVQDKKRILVQDIIRGSLPRSLCFASCKRGSMRPLLASPLT